MSRRERDSVSRPNWRFIKLLSCPSWCTPARHGQFTAGMLKSWTGYTWITCAGYSIYSGRTRSQTLKSSTAQNSRASTLSWAQPSFADLVMLPECLPKRLFYSGRTVGKQSVGTLKASLKDFNINPESWEGLAAERCTWCSLIRKGAISSEKNRVSQAEKKRELRKSGATSTSTPGSVHVCSTCSRTFRAWIGLISHSRTHRPQSLD